MKCRIDKRPIPLFLSQSESLIQALQVVLTVRDSLGCESSSSDTIHVLALISSSIYDIDKYFIHIYPNPASSVIYIEVSEVSSINICNALGQKIMSRHLTPGHTAIDISTLPVGVYTATVKTGRCTEVLRLLKE
jgi:hypothetical protein